MIIARVLGSAVSTAKDPSLTGLKLLVVAKTTPANEVTGEPFVAADTVGAGDSELVLISEGSSARETQYTQGKPVDAAIVGIVDSLEVEDVITFRKQ